MGSVFLSLFLTRGGASGGAPLKEGAFQIFFVLIFALHFLNDSLDLGVIAFYIYNLFKNDRVDKDKCVGAVVLFMGNIMAMPVYWYLYIWRDDESPSSTSNAPRALNNAEGYNPAAQGVSNQREKEYVPPTQPPNWRE